jgi:hypothetical protein
MYNSIIDKLEAILNTITEIKKVYDTEVVTTTNYPYATITPISRSSVYKTIGSGYNERKYQFAIRVYANLKDTTINGQTALRAIADKIDIALEKQSNITLGGTVTYSELSDASFRFVSAETGLYVYEVIYKANVAFSRNV